MRVVVIAAMAIACGEEGLPRGYVGGQRLAQQVDELPHVAFGERDEDLPCIREEVVDRRWREAGFLGEGVDADLRRF